MSGRYASPFDELIENNRKQMEDVLGSSHAFRTPARTPVHTGERVMAAPSDENTSNDTTKIAGSVNGVPFVLNL